MKALLLLIAIILLWACKKNTPFPVDTITGSNPDSTSLSITVKDRYLNSSGYVTDSAMTKSDVLLYGSAADLQLQHNLVSEKMCDMTGSATFLNLSKSKYYILVKHPKLGNKAEDITMSLNAVSNQLEIDY